MLNTIYRLIEPRKIEIEFNDIKMNDDQVIVRPTHLSICNADQRYYQGTRDPEVLAKKAVIGVTDANAISKGNYGQTPKPASPKHWVVYSDREDNVTYTKPDGRLPRRFLLRISPPRALSAPISRCSCLLSSSKR